MFSTPGDLDRQCQWHNDQRRRTIGTKDQQVAVLEPAV
jgi:hypothetical protein